jgi:hypothetical protein
MVDIIPGCKQKNACLVLSAIAIKETINLTRQARDKHREELRTKAFLCAGTCASKAFLS